jgi:hypothetical protein
MMPVHKALSASLLVVALVELFWVSLFVVGYGSVGSNGAYLVAQAVAAALLLWGFVLAWRGSPRWVIPVALGGLVHLMVVSPVVLGWLLTGNFGLFWTFAATTVTHDSVGFWLKFDILMFQCLVPAYFVCIFAFIAWRTIATRGAFLRGHANEG